MTYNKKLTEVAIPLDIINDASAYDKMPGIGAHFSQQRYKLSEKLSKMTKEEILEYFKERKTQLTIKPSITGVWQKNGFGG